MITLMNEIFTQIIPFSFIKLKKIRFIYSVMLIVDKTGKYTTTTTENLINASKMQILSS